MKKDEEGRLILGHTWLLTKTRSSVVHNIRGQSNQFFRPCLLTNFSTIRHHRTSEKSQLSEGDFS